MKRITEFSYYTVFSFVFRKADCSFQQIFKSQIVIFAKNLSFAVILHRPA